MTKFAIGDIVSKGNGNTGKVVAVFTTVDGERRYAVENEGALQFVLETELVPHQPQPRAA
jgi:hypothetical protein